MGRCGATTSFPGRYGRIAGSANTGYAVVYDKGNSESQDIRVKFLGPDLKDVWETRVLTAAPSFIDFGITPASAGGWLVSGARDGRCYLASIGPTGATTGVFQAEPVPTSLVLGACHVRRDNTDVVLGSSTVDATDKAHVSELVRVLRLRL